jgi:hypothetical protein
MVSIPDGQMSLPGGHAAVCQVKHLDKVTPLYPCILVYLYTVAYLNQAILSVSQV